MRSNMKASKSSKESRAPHRFLRDKSGVAAVEFALVFPFVMAWAMTSLDFALYNYALLQLTDAVGAGAEYAAQYGPNGACAQDTTKTCHSSALTSKTQSTSPCTAGTVCYYMQNINDVLQTATSDGN